MALKPSLLSLVRTLVILVGSLFLGASCRGQGEAGPPPNGLVAPRFDLAGSRFFWCAGVADTVDLNAYVAAGFDTLVVPLLWRAGDDGALFDANFTAQRTLAREGAKRGLKIVFALPASPEGLVQTHISAASPSYSALWTNWTQSAVASLLDTPGLAGWMLPDDSRALVAFDDAGFRRYLTTRFASIDALNARWGTNYADFDSVAISDVEALVGAWKRRVSTRNRGALPALGSLGSASDPGGDHPRWRRQAPRVFGRLP